MIGKGNLHANGSRLAVYMMDGGKADLLDARGFASDDLEEAFATIQAIADSQTHCDKPFFHAYIRLAPGENLTADQWLSVADRFEQTLGFVDQPRAITLHTDDNGDRHLHVAWSRIDTERMCAIDPGLYKNKMVDLCRELEIEYDLQRVSSEREAGKQTKAPARPEFEQGRRLGVDVEAVRENIRECFDRSDSGSSFVAALAEQGLTLTRGDRRDFVVVDAEGGLHVLSKRICGVNAADIRGRIGEEVRLSLPAIGEVHEQLVLQRTTKDDALIEAKPEPRPANATVSEIQKAFTSNDTDKGLALALDDRGPAHGTVTANEAAATRPDNQPAHVISLNRSEFSPFLERGLSGATRLLGAAFSAVADVAESLIGGLLDGMTGGGEQAPKMDPEPKPAPLPEPALPGQMPDPEQGRNDRALQAEVARQVYIMQAAMENNQEARDRRSRDGGRGEDLERERPR